MRTLAEIIPLRTAACRDALDAVASIAAEEPGVDPEAGAHVATCLRCQAEVAAYRRVLRTMRAMKLDVLPVPPGHLAEVLRAIEAAAEDETLSAGASRAVRAACVGGLTAAGAAGMLVWFNRRRLGLPHAS